MSGTIAGGKAAAAKNLAKDPDFYRRIGAKGGRKGHTGGFFANRNLARAAGVIGGAISRRNGPLSEEEKNSIRLRYGAGARAS